MMHHWEGLPSDPDNCFGFIYLIVNTKTKRKYVGKKQYWMSAGKSKRRVTDKSSKKWNQSHWRESDWKGYMGSSKELLKDIKKHGKKSFTFTILLNCLNKGSLHYEEIKEQVSRDVLRVRLGDGYEYFNKQIAAVRFRPPSTHSKETREKLKKHIETNGHPMQGKVHPNKGKKLPQTAPKKHVSKDNVQITDGQVNLWWPKEDALPKGYRVGITCNGYTYSRAVSEANKRVADNNHRAAKERYENNPSFCLNCSGAISYEGKQKKWRTCSPVCRSEWRSKISSGLKSPARVEYEKDPKRCSVCDTPIKYSRRDTCNTCSFECRSKSNWRNRK